MKASASQNRSSSYRSTAMMLMLPSSISRQLCTTMLEWRQGMLTEKEANGEGASCATVGSECAVQRAIGK